MRACTVVLCRGATAGLRVCICIAQYGWREYHRAVLAPRLPRGRAAMRRRPFLRARGRGPGVTASVIHHEDLSALSNSLH